MESLFLYSENRPLIFTDSFFWWLFAALLLVYQGVHKNISVRNAVLLGFSMYFYYLSSGFFFVLLIISTFIDYYIGEAIHKSDDQKRRKLLVALSVTANLLLLGYFKYTFFFIESINWTFGSDLEKLDLLSVIGNFIFGDEMFNERSIFLPVGISFFTFQTISYSVDLYRNKIKPVKHLGDFAFFVSFFPQLVAGPIVRASDFVPQIRQPYKLTQTQFGHAVFLIIVGLVKKILISDYISVNFVDRVFIDPLNYSGIENLLATYGYALQIYCDFSGYTDIAIGVALLLGFQLPLNFNSPYKAHNITDFWRRWHISLSSWLRDYLYIPLGGNRKGEVRTYANLLLTMLLGGLWHGAAGRFIIWGALHGGALALHKLWMRFMPQNEKKNSLWYKLLSGFITFHFVCLCWIYFRAASTEKAHEVIGQIVFDTNFTNLFTVLSGFSEVFWVMLIGYVMHLTPGKIKKRLEEFFIDLDDVAKAVLIFFIILFLFQIRTAELQPFIYFQF